MQLTKPAPVIEIAESEKPDWLEISLTAPDAVGPASAETIFATVKNKLSRPVAAPVVLIAPDTPEELAVRVSKPTEQLILLQPGEEKNVSWVALFPSKLQENFYYNFTLEAKTMGASASKTVRGSLEGNKTSVEQIAVNAVDYSISGEGLSLSVTVENQGGEEATAMLYASVAGVEKKTSLVISALETKTATFVFENGQNATGGEIRVVTQSQTLRQQFTIEKQQPQETAWAVSPEAVVTLAVLILAMAAFLLLKSRTAYQEV